MKNLASLFLLDDSVTFLNHGSFGACPKELFTVYQDFQLQMEREPVQFVTTIGPRLLKESRTALGEYIRCDADDVVFTTNPTYAINIIAKSLDLKPGDEILATNHEYGAMDRTWKYYCRKSGAKYVTQQLSLPFTSREKCLEEFWAGYTERTRVVFINQVSSPTALIFPVKEICERARELGLITIVDGAHVPGHLPLDLSELKADIYTGACHKWMLTPKGNSFLYVRKELQDQFDPLLISWGYESERPGPSRFLDYHEYQGTRDFSAFLTLPAAVKFLREHHWDSISALCRTAVLENYESLCEIAGTKPIAPLTPEFLGQMCSIPIRTDDPDKIKRILFEQFRIEIPVVSWLGRVFVRMSLNGYNKPEDIEKLGNALKELKSRNMI